MNEGQLAHARRMLLSLGRDRFGEPTAEQENKVNGMDRLDRLDR